MSFANSRWSLLASLLTNDQSLRRNLFVNMSRSISHDAMTRGPMTGELVALPDIEVILL